MDDIDTALGFDLMITMVPLRVESCIEEKSSSDKYSIFFRYKIYGQSITCSEGRYRVGAKIDDWLGRKREYILEETLPIYILLIQVELDD